jgi:hypothetical protein
MTYLPVIIEAALAMGFKIITTNGGMFLLGVVWNGFPLHNTPNEDLQPANDAGQWA